MNYKADKETWENIIIMYGQCLEMKKKLREENEYLGTEMTEYKDLYEKQLKEIDDLKKAFWNLEAVNKRLSEIIRAHETEK